MGISRQQRTTEKGQKIREKAYELVMGKDPSHARNLIALGHKWLATIAASRPGESMVLGSSGPGVPHFFKRSDRNYWLR